MAFPVSSPVAAVLTDLQTEDEDEDGTLPPPVRSEETHRLNVLTRQQKSVLCTDEQ